MSIRLLSTAAIAAISLLTATAPSNAFDLFGLTITAGTNKHVAYQQTRTEVVSFADLNLDKPAGAATLLSRLRAAADRACGNAPAFRELVQSDYLACKNAAVDKAVASLNRPTVTAAHTSRTSLFSAATE